MFFLLFPLIYIIVDDSWERFCMLVITDTRLNHVARRRYRSSRGMHVYIPRALFCCTSPGPQEIVIKALGNCASCYIVIDRDDSIHTHTHVWRKYRHIHINNKQKLRLIYPTWNSIIIRPRLFFLIQRARRWELAVVIDPPRGNLVPELPSGGGRCHSPSCTSTHARYISARYIYAQHKVAGKRRAVKRNKKNLIYTCPYVARTSS